MLPLKLLQPLDLLPMLRLHINQLPPQPINLILKLLYQLTDLLPVVEELLVLRLHEAVG